MRGKYEMLGILAAVRNPGGQALAVGWRNRLPKTGHGPVLRGSKMSKLQ